MSAGSAQSVRQALERAVGSSNVGGEVAGYLIDGLRPSAVAFPNTVQELSQVMAAAWEESLAVAPWGGGTLAGLGNAISRLDAVVNLSRLSRVVQHNPADLTATVEAGITVAKLQRTLAEHGQFLAIDPPLPDRATIGGTLAAGLSGPLKWQYGVPRDLVIGMKVVQADGKATKSGGQVVKNVSGFDMARLHIGGLGTLGIIAEVSFKLTPLPQKEATLVASFATSHGCLEAGLAIFHSDAVPLALACFDRQVNERARAVNLDGPHFLAIRLGGRPLALQRQASECLALCRRHDAKAVETLDEAGANLLWRRVADFGWDAATTPEMAGRASLLPAKILDLLRALEQSNDRDGPHPAVISHPGYGTVLMRWFANGAETSDDVASRILSQARQAVHKAGGRMTIERCPAGVKARLDVWDEVGEPLAIMRRLKAQYDPKGILNPGRFVGGI